MKRVVQFCGGILLGLLAVAILWNAPDLYNHDEHSHPAVFTRIVGLAIIVQGVLAAIGAALCLGRTFVPLTLAPTASGSGTEVIGGGPVLPVCGILFLVAVLGVWGEADRDSGTLEVLESNPVEVLENWPGGLTEDYRREARTDWTFVVLWLAIGGGLLGTPLFLKPAVRQVKRQLNGIGCGIVLAGFLVSGVGALLWVANGLTGEGANRQLSLVGHLGVLAGAVVAMGGSIIAVARKSHEP